MTTGAVATYLGTVIELRLVSETEPFGADPGSRSGRGQLDDAFLRFWCRFVFGFEAELEAGFPAGGLFDAEVAPALADRVAPVFEAWALEWLRAHRADGATRWGTGGGTRPTSSVGPSNAAPKRSTPLVPNAVASRSWPKREGPTRHSPPRR